MMQKPDDKKDDGVGESEGKPPPQSSDTPVAGGQKLEEERARSGGTTDDSIKKEKNKKAKTMNFLSPTKGDGTVEDDAAANERVTINNAATIAPPPPPPGPRVKLVSPHCLVNAEAQLKSKLLEQDDTNTGAGVHQNSIRENEEEASVDEETILPARQSRKRHDIHGDNSFSNSQTTTEPGAVAIYPFTEGSNIEYTAEDAVEDDAIVQETRDSDNRGDEEDVEAGATTVIEPPQIQEDPLLNATLVESGFLAWDDDDKIVLEAKPAPEGFQAIVGNERFKYLFGGFCCLLVLAVALPLAILLPGSNNNDSLRNGIDLTMCGTRAAMQTDYKGTKAHTATNRTC